jgi:hypothetical protein
MRTATTPTTMGMIKMGTTRSAMTYRISLEGNCGPATAQLLKAVAISFVAGCARKRELPWPDRHDE